MLLDEVGQHLAPMLRQDTLRMKLHAGDGEAAMLESHHKAVYFAWDQAIDSQSAVSYRVHVRNSDGSLGTAVATTTALNAKVSMPSSATSYVVVALDQAGNVSTPSNVVTIGATTSGGGGRKR